MIDGVMCFTSVSMSGRCCTARYVDAQICELPLGSVPQNVALLLGVEQGSAMRSPKTITLLSSAECMVMESMASLNKSMQPEWHVSR